MARVAGPHASDEALLALMEPGPTGPLLRTRAHLEGCGECGERLAELRRVKRLLNETAARERMPERDLAFGALRRLRRRQTAISNVNEFFGVIFAIMRGLGSLLAVDESERREPGAHSKGTGDRHG